MRRRDFLGLLVASSAAAARNTAAIPLGLNTYCLRALRLHDIPLLDYTASLKLDSCFLQDSLDPEVMIPAHWAKVRDHAARLGLTLQTGGGTFVPKTPDAFEATVKTFEHNIERAKGLGSTTVRCLLAGDRASFPPGPVEQHMETAVKGCDACVRVRWTRASSSRSRITRICRPGKRASSSKPPARSLWVPISIPAIRCS
jgi:hypothetical protein